MNQGGEMETKGMSEYERERQKRIEENRKMLEELFPDGTSLSGPVVRRGPVVKEGTPESSKDGDGTYGSPVTPRTRARYLPFFSILFYFAFSLHLFIPHCFLFLSLLVRGGI